MQRGCSRFTDLVPDCWWSLTHRRPPGYRPPTPVSGLAGGRDLLLGCRPERRHRTGEATFRTRPTQKKKTALHTFSAQAHISHPLSYPQAFPFRLRPAHSWRSVRVSDRKGVQPQACLCVEAAFTAESLSSLWFSGAAA